MLPISLVSGKKCGDPIFLQIVRQLQNCIIRGILHDGEKLPPEPELAAQFGVSRPTLRKSLQELKCRGLLCQRKGLGTFITCVQDRTWRFAVTGMDYNDSYAALIMAGLNDALAEERVQLFFMEHNREDFLLRDMIHAEADGVLLLSASQKLIQCASENCFGLIPYVILNYRPRLESSFPAIHAQPNQLHDAMNHLAELGHRRIAYLSYAGKSSDMNDRDSSYRQAVIDYNLDQDPELFVCDDGHMFDYGHQAAAHLAEMPCPPTAMVCSGRTIALGAWQALTERGLKIPDDISIIGFDVPEWVNPHMSTLMMPRREMAKYAAQALLNKVRTGQWIPEQKFQTYLVDRGSISHPPKKHS